MNAVEARVWRFKIVLVADGQFGVEADEVARGSLSAGLARLVHINALACDLDKQVDYRVRVHEARLLTSYLASAGEGEPLRVNYPAYTGSSSHIRRFVTECAGLGVLTAASEALFAWEPGADALHSFDVLPTYLKPAYGGLGVRPDLLFHLQRGPVAGEARGRHRQQKTLFPKNADSKQRKRLLELATWSEGKDDHPYFMSWVWIGREAIGVDIFLPKGAPLETNAGLGIWAQVAEGERWTIYPPHRREPERYREPGRPGEPDEELGREELIYWAADDPLEEWLTDGRTRVEAAAARAADKAKRVTDGLYRTSGPSAGSFGGIPVRGDWAPADALGAASHEVFIGILGDEIPSHLRTRRRLEGSIRADDDLDVHLEGRLLTVVRRVSGDDRPSLERLEEGLLSGQ